MDSPVILSVRDEIAEMRRRWPEFQVTGACSHVVTWRGTLTPLRCPYEVRIVYGPRRWLGRFRLLNRRPRVEILSPNIVVRHPGTGEFLPHVYAFPIADKPPLLCLYDPAADEWSPGMPIAHTIIPWAVHWIACYEAWLATGTWSGGGRHPDLRDDRSAPTSAALDTANFDPTFRRQLAEAVAAKIGTHASRALLELGAAGSDDPLAVPQWCLPTDIAAAIGEIAPLTPRSGTSPVLRITRDAA